MPKYQGKLELRLKTTRPAPEQPDEVHIISFPTVPDFEAYRQDSERISYASLLTAAVEKGVLIEGASFPAN